MITMFVSVFSRMRLHMIMVVAVGSIVVVALFFALVVLVAPMVVINLAMRCLQS